MIFQPELIAQALRKHQWEDLACLAETLQAGIPAEMARTDPARFQMWMKGLTHCYLVGWNQLDANVLRSMAKTPNGQPTLPRSPESPSE